MEFGKKIERIKTVAIPKHSYACGRYGQTCLPAEEETVVCPPALWRLAWIGMSF